MKIFFYGFDRLIEKIFFLKRLIKEGSDLFESWDGYLKRKKYSAYSTR